MQFQAYESYSDIWSVIWSPINETITPIDGWEVLSEEVNGRHSHLIEYYKDCRRGNIIIGCELMTTLEMLIQDLKNPEYRFDLEKPHLRIRFIESELKHFESPFAGDPFILTIEQKAIAEAVFGFEIYDPERGQFFRRFKEVFLLIARKNGKTPFTAALTMAEWFCGEAGQKVMCASNDDSQASIIFDCINNMREESPTIRNCTRKNNSGISWGNPRQKKKTGKFSQQNKGTIKKITVRTKAKEGRNLKIVIVDEVHEMQDRSIVAPLRSSLTTQDEPLYFEITTEGVIRDGYLDDRLALARKVLRGELERKRWLIWLYTQDNEQEIWSDERTWQKSNPLLGKVKKRSDLRDLVEEARVSGSQRAFTLAKEFNIKQSSSTSWLDEKIIVNPAQFKLADFRGSWCLGAADLAETNDLCSVGILLMRPNDPTKYIHTMYFVTEAKADDVKSTESPTNPEKKDYRQWEREGLCRIVKGNIIDDDVAANYLMEIYNEYRLRVFRVGYDLWHAKEFSKIVASKLGEKVPIKIPMDFASLNVPMRHIEEDLRAGLINYNNNAICRWNLRNTAVAHNKLGWIMPVKRDGYIGNKIDGTVTKAILYAVLRQHKTEFMSKLGG